METKEFKNQIPSEEQLKKIYGHKTRRMIVQLLNMYNELSLSQLSKIMKKKKTTIQYHVTELRNSNIVRESRISSEESRGSIPTKYYTLRPLNLDYHLSFETLKNISDLDKRIEEYKSFLFGLKRCIINLDNILSYAKEGVESSLRRIEKLEENPETVTPELFTELDHFIQNHNSSISIFSTAESPFLEICKLVPEMYGKFEKIENNYYSDEKTRLKAAGKADDEIKSIFQTEAQYSEGYQVITILHPIKNLIEAALENEAVTKKSKS
ncbi:MAG: ArsR family transcriptional regulator [Candidatus Hodarchaeota archaeon]